MRWLKSLVIVLGIFIVCGVALLGYGFYKKSTDPDWKLTGGSKPLPAPTSTSLAPLLTAPPLSPPDVFGKLSLNLPEGCFIGRAKPDGQRLYITTGPREICRDVIVIDINDGRVLGTISARP